MSDGPSRYLTHDLGAACARRARPLLTRAAGALAAAAWLTAAVLILVQVTTAPMGAFSFALCVCWLVNTATLGLGLGLLGGGDPRQERALTCGLDLGDPRLDAILVPGRSRMRARWSVRRFLGQCAAVAWVLSGAYTYQVAVGTYDVAHGVSVAVLMCLLSAAVSSTVCTVVGSYDARREAAFNLLVEAHLRCRGDSARLADLAEGADDAAVAPPYTADVVRIIPGRRGGTRARGA